MKSTRFTLHLTYGTLVILAIHSFGCAGGVHQKGQHQIAMLGAFGSPFSTTERGDNASVTLEYDYFLEDRIAFIANATPYRNYNQPEGDSYAAEWQIGLRYFFAEFDLGQVPVAFYTDLLGGIMYSQRSIPQDGNHANFVADVGVGSEWPVTDNIGWVTGVRLRHSSNGGVFGGGPNPGQDDLQVYSGIALTLK